MEDSFMKDSVFVYALCSFYFENTNEAIWVFWAARVKKFCVNGFLCKARCEWLFVKGSLCALLCSNWRVFSVKRRGKFMVTRCKILELQMRGRPYFLCSSFLVLT